MSSGVGVTGTLGRCYPFFADLKKCVVSPVSLFLGTSDNALY